MSQTAEVRGPGIGFGGLLTILFIALKLTGYISWSWLWVLAPLWIGIAFSIIIMLIVLAIVLVAAAVRSR